MSQFPNNPYSPGSQPFAPRAVVSGPPPAVLTWQIVYLAFMVVLYLLCAGLGIFFLLNADAFAADDAREPLEFQIMGVVYTVLGIGLALLFAGGIFVRRGMVGWVYNLVLIVIGLTSCCLWPATIPLLIFWIKGKDYVVNQ